MSTGAPTIKSEKTVEPIKAVIFDWGGTLSEWAEVDMEDMWRLGANHIAKEAGLDERSVLTSLIDVEQRLWRECAGAGGEKSFRLVDIFEAASDELEVDVAEAVIEEAVKHHLDSWTPHVRHDPVARATLQAIAALGLRIGMLSNTHWPDHFHEHFLERDGLLEFIDVRVYTSNEMHMKPHPDIFDLAANRLGVEAHAVLFVGDRQWDDIHGAQRAGMRAVWKNIASSCAHDGVTPDFEIQDLGELVPLIKSLPGQH